MEPATMTPPPAANATPPAAGAPPSLVNQTTPPPAQPTDWRAGLPEELRALPAIADYKDVASLVKSHTSLQSMIGKDKIVLPNDKSTPEEVAEFQRRLGRPETPEGYKLPPVKFSNGSTIPKETLEHFNGVFHRNGFSNKQAEGLMKEFAEYEDKRMVAHAESVKQSQAAGIEQLKKDYGQAFDERVNAAQIAVKTFGSPELTKWLDDTGLGNDANFVRFFSNIGQALLEDKAVGGGGVQFQKTPVQAQKEIADLKSDKDFLRTLTNPKAPGHAEAKARWDELHVKATPVATKS